MPTVVQINLKRSSHASANLGVLLREKDIDIGLIQESWTRDGRISGIAIKGYTTLYTSVMALWYNNSIYGLLENTSTFWSEVKRYRDSAGNPYEDVVNFALSLLSLPWSNAEVERDFSQVNLVKTKIRNRLEVDTLNAILAIRFGLRHHKLCCHNYNLPEKYLQLIGSMATYEDSNDDDGKIIEDALKLLS
nr:uncharacterized protein LOC121502837 [Drosophila kikkawai]